MTPIRRHRQIKLLLLVITLLITQWALASYVCPGLTELMQPKPAAMAGCTKMDMEQPTLCVSFDKVGKQSADRPDLPPVLPFAAQGIVLVLCLLVVGWRGYRQFLVSPSLRRATAPPLAIRHCCFRN
ncbi:hypothetical protein [Massilia sp. erpn]|uniref:hypothetical protein n=1 Tax=Massilia sp. erpn TaxID=2738142 RepID=UPI0021063A70|nr:hypothetical protein [Massilia sp. erpn]UTY59501.1 hypothetical protein HPQ68_21390 [Massilia sp. erpn]